MSFFEHQDRARQNTQWLLGLFTLAVGGMVLTIYAIALFAFGLQQQGPWQPQLFGLVAASTLLVIGGGTGFKLWQLRQGGRIIAEDLGGELLLPDSAETDEDKQLLNVVEEMAIAANITVPAVYVLNDEMGINAFAAGYDPNDAVIGITRGCLNELNRDELQGVIAHEFSHILNGDMRLNLRLVGLLNGLLLIYLAGRVLFNWQGVFSQRSRNRDRNAALDWFGLGLIVVGLLGVMFGRLIQSAVSRQREFLADASAVQFTRNPSGIGNALEKILSSSSGSQIHSPYAEASSHLFFGNALGTNFFDFFATHPPLEQRIGRLKAYGGYKQRSPSHSQAANSQAANSQAANGAGSRISQPEQTMGFAGGVTQSTTGQAGTGFPATAVNTNSAVEMNLPPWALQLPEPLQTGWQDPEAARAIAYSLILDPSHGQLQEHQLRQLQAWEPALTEQITTFGALISPLAASLRLPLLNLALLQLAQSLPADREQLCQRMKVLATLDGCWTMAEFALVTIATHQLQTPLQAESTRSRENEHDTLTELWPACQLVIGVLAQAGQFNPTAIAYAFRAGLEKLPGIKPAHIPDQPLDWNFDTLRESLTDLQQITPRLKKAVLQACAHTVLIDNKVTATEADLLWTIATVLDCPIPAFLQPTAANSKGRTG
uniref:Peptidase M48 Ste24p n=1 Tax=Cyanothece sp. (strain PCC 7425 / ATCC 29141) TaxID=395961 RepID=B8HQ67_CYAP4